MPTRKPQHRVLIVDDMPQNIQFLAETLSEEYEVIIATSGEQALEMVSAEEQPDIVLLDIMLPDMDGYEVCRQLKRDESTQHIPVIFVTAKDDAADEERGLNLGAVDYISKPYHLPIVKARVRTHLLLKLKTDLLSQLTATDEVTGIANRRAFNTTFAREIARAKRDELGLSLLLIDIDSFKAFNDTYGHRAGDECLRAVAEVMSLELKRPADLIARFGGEEFAVVLPAADKDEAFAVAENIRNAVSLLNIESKNALGEKHLTVSVGCATGNPLKCPDDFSRALIDAADKQLYLAKAHGRNQSRVAENMV
jgi:diguanylate cyclase (GGDEF)-like protein